MKICDVLLLLSVNTSEWKSTAFFSHKMQTLPGGICIFVQDDAFISDHFSYLLDFLQSFLPGCQWDDN